MNCLEKYRLEKYRSKLIREINKDLRIILAKSATAPEQDAVHNFRVGVKRLTALYYFLNEINPDLSAKQILKPYRSLFKPTGNIRDWQIALHLVQNLAKVNAADSEILPELIKALRARIRQDYRRFQKYVQAHDRRAIRMPTIRGIGVSETAIFRYKPRVLNNIFLEILRTESAMIVETSNRANTGTNMKMNMQMWHKKRILIKRYRHTLEAFCFCPSHKADEDVLKQMKILEQLLGDWHDRVITIQLLQSFQGRESQTAPIIAIMKKQERLLLGSAKIYFSNLCLNKDG